MKLYIADAFTDTLFGGNPAGVVILESDSDFPDPATMRKTAAELRYSETAFIRPLSQCHDSSCSSAFEVRYFTPADEVDLCGHATIAAFYCLKAAGLTESGKIYLNRTLAGNLHIEVSDDSILMDMASPQYISTIDDDQKLRELYTVMGLEYSPNAVQTAGGRRLLPEIISTGLPDIIMPVESRELLDTISPDFPALSRLSADYGVTGVHAFVPADKSSSLKGNVSAFCRNFAPLYDIDEEAATGTANGALTYYMIRNGLTGKDCCGSCLFVQGEAMERPSNIQSHWTISNSGDVSIQIGGGAAILASGTINL